LRRRNYNVTSEEQSAKKEKFSCGDLIYINTNKNFPITLREGPGYTFKRVDFLEHGKIGIIVNYAMGHGMIIWLCILASQSTVGWIPGSIAQVLKKLEI